MLRRACVLGLLSSVGCHPDHGGPPPARADAAGLEPGERSLDPFLALDADLDAIHPLRATVRRAGAIFVEHDGVAVNDPSNRNVRVSARVIDEDAGASPSRPRILCESDTHRVAVHVEIDDLATVASRDATLVGVPPVRDELGTEPGIRVAPGAELVPAGHGDPDVLRMRHEGAFVRVEGLVAATNVGIAFRPGELASDADGPPDAAITQPTAMLATPFGVQLAKLDARGTGELLVRRLGRTVGTQVLVRYEEPNVHVVGWVEASVLAVGPRTRMRAHTTTGSGRETTAPLVTLPRGTLLLGSALRRPIGILLAETALPCRDDCEGAEPKVRVAACTDAIEVWARRP